MIAVDVRMPRLFAQGTGELAVQLELPTGSLTALVGPSGSGKTTLLRLLAGLEKPQPGRIVIDGAVWTDTQQGIHLSPQARSVGYIFQDAALFPNLTVRENIRFVTPKGETALADELLATTGLTPFADQKPSRLSGGQRQRVALARALVRRPNLLLLDEPFAALDADAARPLRQLVGQLHQRWGTTTLLVSHHEPDVAALADRVVRLVEGQIQPEPPMPLGPQNTRERINRIRFDATQGQWELETDTFHLRSAHTYWEHLRPGDEVEVIIIKDENPSP